MIRPFVIRRNVVPNVMVGPVRIQWKFGCLEGHNDSHGSHYDWRHFRIYKDSVYLFGIAFFIAPKWEREGDTTVGLDAIRGAGSSRIAEAERVTSHTGTCGVDHADYEHEGQPGHCSTCGGYNQHQTFCEKR